MIEYPAVVLITLLEQHYRLKYNRETDEQYNIALSAGS